MWLPLCHHSVAEHWRAHPGGVLGSTLKLYIEPTQVQKQLELLVCVIGVILSEPHTSVTSLRTCMCMLAWTEHLPKVLNQQISCAHAQFAFKARMSLHTQ